MNHIFEMKIHDDRLKTPEYLPTFATAGSAGIDLRACLRDEDNIVIDPGQQVIVLAGLSVFIRDPDYVGIIVPRSGKGTSGLVIGNLVGVIDSDYQGQIRICLWNRSAESITVTDFDRVAQLLSVPVIHPTFRIVDEFSTGTERGEGGFGSTGVK